MFHFLVQSIKFTNADGVRRNDGLETTNEQR